VAVDIVRVYVHELSGAPAALGIHVVWTGVPHYHDAVTERDVSVVGLAVRALHAQPLGEAGHVHEPVDGGVDVLAQQIRG
jgi:hypothetical protein